ncbi:MAG: hypothetical protein GF313_07105 [Caldithrix sp.]|nr:hypothetical protein [Caldithrix sp.]
MKGILIGGLSLLVLWGCASSKKTVAEKPAAEEKEDYYYDESFDPLTLNDDDLTIEKTEDKAIVTDKSKDKMDSAEESSTAESTDAIQEVDGFRVQIIATKDFERATLVHRMASDQFSEDSIKVYLKYEAPLYKVRIGDAVQRRHAEEIRSKALNRFEYDGAFIVPSKVYKKKEQF